MARDARLKIRLDLSSPERSEKLTGEGKVNGWNARNYTDPFLTLAGELVDGTAFELVVTERLQVRTAWRLGRSGKMKRKVKRKGRAILALELCPKARFQAALAAVGADAAKAVQLGKDATLLRVQNRGKSLTILAGLPGGWAVRPKDEHACDAARAAAMLFVSGYQVLNLTHTIVKRGKEAA